MEADIYWCFKRLLDTIQDHYTPSQPGIQRMTFRLRELVHRIDGALRARVPAWRIVPRAYCRVPANVAQSAVPTPALQRRSCCTWRTTASSSGTSPSVG